MCGAWSWSQDWPSSIWRISSTSIAGGKSGQWKKWYKVNIPVADDLFGEHLEQLEGK